MNLSNIWALGVKELRGLMRDPVLMVLIFYAFSLSIYTSSKVMPETLNKAAISVVDEDRSQVSRRIADAFYPPYFVPPKLITQPEMDARMDAGIDTFALNIPPNFQRQLLGGHRPVLQLNVDATRITQAFTGAGYIARITDAEISEYLGRHRSQPAIPVNLTLRSRFNPDLNKQWFGAISNVITAITLLSIVLTGAALIREREHGTVEHLLVMPVTSLEIMTSKVWSMALVVLMAAGAAFVVIVQGFLNVPIPGSLPLFLGATVLHLFATTSMGIFLATFAGSMPQFGMLLVMVFLPLQVLSGGLTPRESMPDAIQYIMLAAPDTHFNIIAQAVLFRGAGIDVIWPQMVTLTLIGAVLFWVALRRFRGFLQ
ncbi:MAG: ABC transporter permease [Rhodobacteraceae bacterium]|nr:ABC transporter permease [Paracoccaceae bacterium]